MERLNTIVDEAVAKLKGELNDDQLKAAREVIEAATIRGILEGQHHAVDTFKNMEEVEMDTAHRIAAEIRKKNDALITNLSSLR